MTGFGRYSPTRTGWCRRRTTHLRYTRYGYLDTTEIPIYLNFMRVFVALSALCRSATVLAVVAIMAFGAFITPASAGHHDHHEMMSVDDVMHGSDDTTELCVICHGSDLHEAGQDSCCVATCATILNVAFMPPKHMGRISEIDPLDHATSGDTHSVEYIRPPSLSI